MTPPIAKPRRRPMVAGQILRPDRRTLYRMLGVVFGMFAAGYLIAVFMLFPPPPVPEDGTVVPNLIGQSVEQARRALQAIGLDLTDSLHFPHPDAPDGLIIAQSPLAGQQARSGAIVRVGVSSGLPSVVVPDVVGFGAERASTLLRRLGFEVDQTRETSEQPAGIVLRSSPSGGASEPLPARVLLVVSSGTPIPVDTLPKDTIAR